MTKLLDQDVEKARSNIVGVIESYGVVLHPRGKQFNALCPFHSEKTPSMAVVPQKGFYKCFGCGSGGDAIDFVMNFATTDFRSAVQLINGSASSGNTTPIKTNLIKVEESPGWKPMPEVPTDAPLPLNIINRQINGQWVKLTSETRWEYRSLTGALMGYVYRFDLPNGGKEVLPQTWCVNQDGELSWRWQSTAKPRPLFGLELLTANPLANVLIVEGEKTACAARKIFNDLNVPPSRIIVMSWTGGGNSVKFVDWSPISGRKICLWPDADQKNYKSPHPLSGQLIPFMQQIGTLTMLDIYNQLGRPTDCKFIIPPSNVCDGWDLADEFPDGFNFLAHLKTAVLLSNMKLTPEVVEPAQKNIPNAESPAIGLVEKNETDLMMETSQHENTFFRILGYDHEFYYIFQYEKCQIITYTKGDFSESGLIELAPLEWWESTFGGPKGGINKSMALNWIMRTANARGIYDMSRIRGRGAWRDKKRSVFHHGDFLTVDNERIEINEFSSHYVYERRKRFPDISEIPLSDEDGAKILEISSMFRWSMPASAALLTGWIALAPICGALPWRSHVWLSGAAGSGKSTILENFTHQLLNHTDLYVQGNSSEAGIRQELKGDAMPVLFDESESNTERDSLRIQSILALIRQSSSESQAKTLKGTSGGDALAFHVRSMFCLASIQVSLKQQADMERMTILNLLPAKDDSAFRETWELIQSRLLELKTDEDLAGRLLRRSLQLLPITLQNIQTFSKAAALKFGSQRDGDQYGTLMAGAWSMISREKITLEEAVHYMGLYEWTAYTEHRDNDDSQRALMALMGSMIRVGPEEITVNELIRCACDFTVSGVRIKSIDADAVLERHGMKVDSSRELILCNNHPQLNELMKGTPFESDLRSVLMRYSGAKKLDRTIRFSGIVSRAYTIPLLGLLETDEEEGETF